MRITALQAKEAVKRKLLEIEGVWGCGVTKSSEEEEIIVYVESEEVIPRLPKQIAGFKVRPFVSGKIRPLFEWVVPAIPIEPLRTTKIRPAPCGVSVGHYAITAGTLGMVVYKGGKLCILSNNHVLANCDSIQVRRAKVGDAILQPGVYDGGTDPADRIGVLGWWVKIDEGKKNWVDAALSFPLDPALVTDEVLGIGKIEGVAEVSVGQMVRKSGRTTGVTENKVLDVDASIKVDYDVFTCWFDDCIVTYAMAKGGDSGSVLVDEWNRAVGLLFAGSDTLTVHCKFKHVARLLGIDVKYNVLLAFAPWFPMFLIMFSVWLREVYLAIRRWIGIP